MLKKIKKILLIIIVFIGFSLLATYIWYMVEKSVFNNLNTANLGFGDFLLYLLGYGDISQVNLTLKLIYSIIGIMTLTLLSSVFTVSLFEWKNKLNISHNMIVWDNAASEHFGSILLNNKYRDIYKLTLTLHLNTGSNAVFEERFIPYVSKGSKQLINYKIETGSILYKYLRDVMKFGYNSTLALIASYVDSSNGQEYVLCNKYLLSKDKNNQIVINNPKVFKIDASRIDMKEFKNFASMEDKQYYGLISKKIMSDGFRVEIEKAQPIRNENIEIHYGRAPSIKREILDISVTNLNSVISSEITFKGKKGSDPDDFGMLLIKRPFDSDWQKFYDLNCILTFDIYVSAGLVVSLEIKDSKGAHIVNPVPKYLANDCYKTQTLDLTTLPREKWVDVDELCFTVFRKDTKTDKGEFSIIGCELVSKNEK